MPVGRNGRDDWNEMLAQEELRQRKSDKDLRRRRDSIFRREKKQEDGGESPEAEKSEAPPKRRAPAWAGFAAQAAPFAVLLLLAPLVRGPAVFYLLVLASALPAALPFLLRHVSGSHWAACIPAALLPVEVYFALQYAPWNPELTLPLAVVSAGAFAMAVHYVAALRRKRYVPVEVLEEPGIEDGRQARQIKGEVAFAAEQGRRRGLLLFFTALAAAALLAPAVQGVGLQLYRPSPNEVSEFEKESLKDDALMTRRMNAAYERLESEMWEQSSREEKRKALQALLDIETDRLGSKRFDLRDYNVFSAVAGGKHTSVPEALLTGKTKTQERVSAMCHLAYHLMPLVVTGDEEQFEAIAEDHAKRRCAEYEARWENREPEVNHA